MGKTHVVAVRSWLIPNWRAGLQGYVRIPEPLVLTQALKLYVPVQRNAPGRAHSARRFPS
jgi:hypothetical protein